MFQAVRNTYEERLNLYNDCTKADIISFLERRDKYKDFIKKTPECLIYKNYDKLSKEFLIELIAERDIYEQPDCCKENE